MESLGGRFSRSSGFSLTMSLKLRFLRNPPVQMVVYRLAYNGDVVAFKMGRRQGARRTRSRGRIPHHFTLRSGFLPAVQNGAGRNRRATQPPAHFQRNPPGHGQLAVFPRCSLGPYESRYGRFARALKNSQLTCGDITIICETAHHHLNRRIPQKSKFQAHSQTESAGPAEPAT